MSNGNMKKVEGDRNTTLVYDFTVGHEYEIIVRAVGPDGTEQAMENAARNTIVIEGKTVVPTTPAVLATSGYINAIGLVWTNPTDYDFDYMAIWRSATNHIDTALQIAEVKGITYLDSIGLSDTTRYYWIRAVNTSGEVSDFYPLISVGQSTGISGRSLGVVATDIADFAVTAAKIYTKIPIVDADSWTNNSPAGGSIAWNAHDLYYNGVKHNINAANTADKYVNWDLSNPSNYQTTNTAPTQTDDHFIICMNNSGTHNVAWNSIANQVIGSAYILDAAIVEAKIGNLAVTNAKIGLLAVDTAQIASLAVTDAKINDLSVNKLTTGIIFSQTITLASSGTDCYLNSGKTDFTNAQSGFIIGVDYSDGSKPKFYIGDDATYFNYTGVGIAVKGVITVVAGSNIEIGADVTLTHTAADATDYTGNTISGVTVQSASSGQRTLISQANNTLEFFIGAGAGTKVVDINAGTYGYITVGNQAGREISYIKDGSFQAWSETGGKIVLNVAYYHGGGWDNVADLDSYGNLNLVSGAYASGGIFQCREAHALVEYNVAGTKVVGAQQAAIANAVDAATTMARLNDLLAACRTHGLINT